MPPVTDDLGSWAAIIGILLPLLVALLQKTGWSSTVNGAIFGVAVVLASVIYGAIKFNDNFTWAHWEETLLAILVWGLATFHTFWRPSGIIDAARANFKKPAGATASK